LAIGHSASKSEARPGPTALLGRILSSF